MSYFKAKCERCGAEYMTGVVGRTLMGGHDCPKKDDSEGPTMTVELRPVDADSLLAALEWAVNHPELEMGPGLHREGAIEAGRRIEAVADLYRRGIAT